MIKVTVADVVKHKRAEDEEGSHALNIVVLQDEAGRQALPIWIGPFEAQSIARGLAELSEQRPMTFDFVTTLLQALNAQIEEVRIEMLKGTTFYAVVKINSGGTTCEVDARPSDAMALAVRTGSPILVAEDVFKRAGAPIPKASKTLDEQKGVQSILKELREMQNWERTVIQSSHQQSPEELKKSINELIAAVFSE